MPGHLCLLVFAEWHEDNLFVVVGYHNGTLQLSLRAAAIALAETTVLLSCNASYRHDDAVSH